MEFKIGPLFSRTLQVSQAGEELEFHPMTKGQQVIGHQHNFDHVTFVWGALTIDLLDVASVDPLGNPLDFKVLESHSVKGPSAMPFFLVKKGVWHRLTADEDGSAYMCAFPWRKPQALTMFDQGKFPQLPYQRVDPDGTVWHRELGDIVYADNGFALAVR